MKFTESLKKKQDFKKVYLKGKSIADRNLVMYCLPNSLNKNRLGISVSKKVGNSVTRSRITRLIKESYRLSESHIKHGYDLIVIARISSKGKTYHEINSSLIKLMKRHNIIN